MLSAAPAQAQSFDCAKAATKVEKAICADDNVDLAEMDSALGRLYAALKAEGGHQDVLSAQAAWLARRDRCSSDAACLTRSYAKRLVELASAAGDTKGVTGTYAYQLTGEGATADSDNGQAFVVREVDGTLSGSIDTVSGPTYHTCSVEFEKAAPAGATWTWQGAPDEVMDEGQLCQITFTPHGKLLTIESDNCRYFCGARGWFDSGYTRVR